MAIPSDPDQKAACRGEARRLLQDVSPARAGGWSDLVTRHLASWLAGQPSIRRVATFASLPGEPDLLALHTLRPERDWLYPLVGPDHSLSFHEVADPSTLAHGSFGIREPDPAVHPQVPADAIEAVLCPGLAFGPDGSRLGRGGGFYDRLLSTLESGCPRVGVAFEVQVRKGLPLEPHDERMSHLATESGVHGIRPPATPA